MPSTRLSSCLLSHGSGSNFLQVSLVNQRDESSTVVEPGAFLSFFLFRGFGRWPSSSPITARAFESAKGVSKGHGPFAACSGRWLEPDEFHCEKYYQARPFKTKSFIHTYIHTYLHTHIQHTDVHTYNIHTYIHTYIHACMHACIHTYIHTYIHNLRRNLF